MAKWTEILFPQYNHCHICERYLPLNHLICPQCIAEMNQERLKPRASQTVLPPLSVCLSSFCYAGIPRELVHLLKYQNDCILAPMLAEALANTLSANTTLLSQIDSVIPVPLHQARLEKRGFNQAELLAQALCNDTQLHLENNILLRIKETDSQVHRTAKMRMKAMQGAFAVHNKAITRGRHFLLVDDVLTTGATALACAEVLLRAHAASVSLITVCKVPVPNPNL